jgi:hypothetical protein
VWGSRRHEREETELKCVSQKRGTQMVSMGKAGLNKRDREVQRPSHPPISSSVMLSATPGINAGLDLADAEAALLDAAAAAACFWAKTRPAEPGD